MSKKDNNETKLAIWFDEKGCKKSVTISQAEEMMKKGDKEGISEFIYHRLHSRYLKIFTYNNKEFEDKFKSGFAMMANYCLLIETLQGFRDGKNETEGNNACAFCNFFRENKDNGLYVFNNLAKDFYKGVRCGILHQGEASNQWKIRREGDIFNTETKTINAIEFGYELEKALKSYTDKIKTDDDLFKNAKKKIEYIIKNCAAK